MFAGQFLQLLGQFDAVHVGHVQVAEHQADLRVGHKRINGFTGCIARHATVTAAFQKLAQFFDNQRLIVDYEHFY